MSRLYKAKIPYLAVASAFLLIGCNGANMDMASHIQTYFKTDSMEDWVEFTNDSKLPSPDAPLIQNLQRCLIPDAVDSMVKIEAHNFTEPIKILLKDYSSTSPDCVFQTGNIYILP